MIQILQQLSPPLRQELLPLVERWPAFVQKLTARVDEVVAEAEVGLDQLIEQHASDFGPMGAAFGALQARVRGIESKIGEAAGKIEEAVWQMMFRDGLGVQDRDGLDRLHSAIVGEERRLREDLEMRYQALHTKKSAQWARKLYELARAELGSEVSCSQCGSPFSRKVFWQSANETCPHCQAVNGLSPGAATYAYFGQGVHALAHEAAFALWKQEQHQKSLLDGLRQPTAYDHWQWLEAARAYWTSYYQHHAQMHPGFAAAHGSIEAATAAKLRHYDAYDVPLVRQQREFFGHMLDAARRRDEPALRQLFASLPPGVDLDDCAEAAMERHDTRAAALVLSVKHQLEGEDEPLERWVNERLRELAESIRSR